MAMDRIILWTEHHMRDCHTKRFLVDANIRSTVGPCLLYLDGMLWYGIVWYGT